MEKAKTSRREDQRGYRRKLDVVGIRKTACNRIRPAFLSQSRGLPFRLEELPLLKCEGCSAGPLWQVWK